MATPNEARGEVAVTIAGQDLVLVAEMARLAKLSAALNTDTFEALYRRVVGLEPRAVMAALEHLAIAGDGKKAARDIKVAEFSVLQAAVLKAFSAHVDEDAPKNAEAASEPSSSPGGNGLGGSAS